MAYQAQMHMAILISPLVNCEFRMIVSLIWRNEGPDAHCFLDFVPG